MFFYSKPDSVTLSANIKDYVVLVDENIIFKLYYGETNILEEIYVPDAAGIVRISKLNKVIDAYIGGSLDIDEQAIVGEFTAKLNGWEQTFTAIRCAAKTAQAGANFVDKYPLNLGHQHKVTYADVEEYLVFVLNQNQSVKVAIDWIDLLGNAHHDTDLLYYTNTLEKCAIMLKTSYNDVFARHFRPNIWQWTIYIDEEANGVQYVLDKREWPQLTQIKYLNSFAVPETIVCRGAGTRKGAQKYSSATIAGVEQKTTVDRNDVIECSSGAFYSIEELHLFREMLSSTDVRILIDGQWQRVIVSEYKETTPLRNTGLSPIAFTYKLADQKDNFRLLR